MTAIIIIGILCIVLPVALVIFLVWSNLRSSTPKTKAEIFNLEEREKDHLFVSKRLEEDRLEKERKELEKLEQIIRQYNKEMITGETKILQNQSIDIFSQIKFCEMCGAANKKSCLVCISCGGTL